MNETRVAEGEAKPRRGWIWATLLTVMGAIYVYDGVQDIESGLGRLLMGLGFLMMAPQAFYNPGNLRRSKGSWDKPRVVDWIGLAGVVVPIVGLVLRFL